MTSGDDDDDDDDDDEGWLRSRSRRGGGGGTGSLSAKGFGAGENSPRTQLGTTRILTTAFGKWLSNSFFMASEMVVIASALRMG